MCSSLEFLVDVDNEFRHFNFSDSILNQMELLNPQLFGSGMHLPIFNNVSPGSWLALCLIFTFYALGETRPFKCEPTDMGYDNENESKLNFASQDTTAASQISTQALSACTNSASISSTSSSFGQPAPPPAKPRINPKSVQAINSGK